MQYKGYWKVKTVDFEFRGDAKNWCAQKNTPQETLEEYEQMHEEEE